jgi:hypothetical protein
MSQYDIEHGTMTSYAKLARAAYDTEKYSKDFEAQGYVLDKELTDGDRSVFHNPQSKKAVVSFRGTRTSNLLDLAADLKIARGSQGESIRFKRSTAQTKRVVAKYGKENVSLTGHSLGGSQAIHVGEKLGLQSHAYNPGIGPKTGIRGVISRLFRSKKKENINIYHTGIKDPISALAPMMNSNVKHVGPRFHKDPHSIANFIF